MGGTATYSILTEQILAQEKMKFYRKTIDDLRAALARERPTRWLEYLRTMSNSTDPTQKVKGFDLQEFTDKFPGEDEEAVPVPPVMSPPGNQPGGDAPMEQQ